MQELNPVQLSFLLKIGVLLHKDVYDASFVAFNTLIREGFAGQEELVNSVLQVIAIVLI